MFAFFRKLCGNKDQVTLRFEYRGFAASTGGRPHESTMDNADIGNLYEKYKVMKKSTFDFDEKYMQGRGSFDYSVNITLSGQLHGFKIDEKFNSFGEWKNYLDILAQKLKYNPQELKQNPSHRPGS